MIETRILRYSLVVCISFLSAVTFAQDKYFIYLQSDNSQPFYVRVDGKLSSSTASGYVILPKLNAGDYTLNIGFPKNEFPEQEFKVSVSDQNEGYLLKKLDQGWSLFNLESMALVESVKPDSGETAVAKSEQKEQQAVPTPAPQEVVKKEEPAPVKSGDAFTSLLATVVKDSSILKENSVAVGPPADTSRQAVVVSEIKPVMVEEQKPITVKEEKQEKEATLQEEKSGTAEVVKEVAKDTAIQNPFVRILMVNEADGQDMVYVNQNTRDTIRLFVQGNVAGIKEDSGSKIIYTPAEKKPDSSATVRIAIKETAPDTPKSRIIYNPDAQDTSNLTITPTIVAPPSGSSTTKNNLPAAEAEQKTARIIYKADEPVNDSLKENNDTVVVQNTIPNTDCTSVADEKDYLRLRRRMAGESDNRKMIDAARRFFKQKCYTTEQIQNLSYLFIDDEGKYQFFDAAYPYVTDPDLFPKLEYLLKDEYFINRFKAMIRK